MRDGWLSWPCWLTDNGRLNRKATHPASSLAQDRESSPTETSVLTTMLRRQLMLRSPSFFKFLNTSWFTYNIFHDNVGFSFHRKYFWDAQNVLNFLCSRSTSPDSVGVADDAAQTFQSTGEGAFPFPRTLSLDAVGLSSSAPSALRLLTGSI